MRNIKQARMSRTQKKLLGAAMFGFCVEFCGGAYATEINTGNDNVKIRFDNTIRYNYGVRVKNQDPSILKNANADDGDRNFGNGSTVTNRLDLLTEFDFTYKQKFGARVSAASWYDHTYAGSLDNTNVATSNHVVNRAPAFGLSNYAERYYNGPSGEILDAFAFGTFDLGSMPLSVRAGRHTVNWGEALLGGGAIHGDTYGQAPLDQAKGFANPGVEAKELYRPLTQISARLQATQTLSLAAQYFFQWQPSRIPEAGTYLGFNDALQFGGESLIVAPGVRFTRTTDITPKNTGDWGLAARWSPEWLDGTVGLYVRDFSDKLPQIILIRTTRQYLLNYAGGVHLYGVSLSKQVAGISFGADLNYRRDMPLASSTVTVATAANLPARGDTLGARGNTLHGVFNALGTINTTPVFNSATWAAELTWNRYLSVTQGSNVFKGNPSYTAIDKVSKDYFGFSANFTPTWYQVFPGADLLLPLSYTVGLHGNSAVAFGGNEHAGSYAAGLGLDLYSRYRFDLKYVDYFGNSTVNPLTGAITVVNGNGVFLKDRGAVYLTFKTTF